MSNEKGMADEDDERDEPSESPKGKGKPKGDKSDPLPYASKGAAARGTGYFTIYKRGQGYWTRVGTVIAIVVIGLFTAYNIYAQTPTFLPGTPTLEHATALKISVAAAVVFLIAYAMVAWRFLNQPTNVDFLISTDSEMKKVNWTSRAELIGSTKVVIIFMFFVAIFLFAVDQIFGWAMYLLHVLKVSPLG